MTKAVPITNTVQVAPAANQRLMLILVMGAAGIFFLTLLHLVLPEIAAQVLLDRGGTMPPYPFSIQNIMWLVFFVGLGELMHRQSCASLELKQLKLGLLPESHDTVLLDRDMGPIYENVKKSTDAMNCVLPQMIQRTVLQFQTTKSIDQSSSVLSSSLDLFMHQLDLKYSFTRYIVWLIPSLGFIGTVVGIAIALNYAGLPSNQGSETLLEEVTRRLAVAFNTTLVGLVQASFLVLLQTAVQSREERAINRAGQYCLDNLINRLYVREHAS